MVPKGIKLIKVKEYCLIFLMKSYPKTIIILSCVVSLIWNCSFSSCFSNFNWTHPRSPSHLWPA